MDNISKRILKLIANKEFKTSLEFAKYIGINNGTLSSITTGRNKPSYPFLYAIAVKFEDLNLRWLITGVGEMWESGNSKIVTEPSPRYGIQNDMKDQIIKSKDDLIESLRNQISLLERLSKKG